MDRWGHFAKDRNINNPCGYWTHWAAANIGKEKLEGSFSAESGAARQCWEQQDDVTHDLRRSRQTPIGEFAVKKKSDNKLGREICFGYEIWCADDNYSYVS